MVEIVCVHGIAQQLQGPETLSREWLEALRDGMRLAGAPRKDLPTNDSIEVAFYGDLFRGKSKGGLYPPKKFSDIQPGFEAELLMTWAKNANLTVPDGGEVDDANKSAWAPQGIQAVARKLLQNKYFSGLSERCMVGSLKQVRQYFWEPDMRQAVRERLSALITPDTRLLIAHSLGTIVAYEVLCELHDITVPHFITLGSPLGLPNLIFHRLNPLPIDERGRWPGNTATWTNIAATQDLVASVKQLNPLFEGKIEDILINNEMRAHNIQPYLTARETGAEILKALNHD